MARWVPNPNFEREFHADIRNETKLRQALVTAARPAVKVANQLGHAIMPKGKGPAVSVVSDAEGVFIVNAAYGSHLDEYGSITNPPYAPVRRGIHAAGLPFRELPR